MLEKKYLKVIAEHRPDGSIRPLKIEYEDRWYEVDRLIDVRMAASLKAGGQGIRYTCKTAGRQVYLFCDEEICFLSNLINLPRVTLESGSFFCIYFVYTL